MSEPTDRSGSPEDTEDVRDFRPRPVEKARAIADLPSWATDRNPDLDGQIPQPKAISTTNSSYNSPGLSQSVESNGPLSASPDDPLHAHGFPDESEGDESVPSTPVGSYAAEPEIKRSPFPVRTDLNSKLSLWRGDIAELRVDAIVNSTNDSMTSRQGVSGRILDVAGPDLLRDLATTEPCKTGECRLTKGHKLPSSWILHTVGPRYNEKYITAAENALHNCYRSCFETALEYSIKTVGISVVHTTRRGYPPETGAPIAIRTIRRFLERWGKDFTHVALVMDTDEMYEMYRRYLALYFPRDEAEEAAALAKLPKDVGNEFGETVVEERSVRIAAFPTSAPVAVASTTRTTAGPGATDPARASPKFDSASLAGLTAMHGDRDSERRRKLQQPMTEEQKQSHKLYIHYLAMAQRTDLSEIARSGVFYQSGVDQSGRPIIVFVARLMPVGNDALLEKLLMYIFHTIDPIASQDYIAVFAYSDMSSRPKPDIAWLKRLYKTVDDQFGDHLHAVYVLHPTFWLKIAEGVASVFSSASRLFSKVKYLDKAFDLFAIVGDQLKLPAEVLKFDQEENGPSSANRITASKDGL